MWVIPYDTVGNSDPVNLDRVVTIRGEIIDKDHYGVFAIVDENGKFGKILLTSRAINIDDDGDTRFKWATAIKTDIMEAVKSKKLVYQIER